MAGYNTHLNGVLYLTRADYDALTNKIAGTLYVVQEASGFSLYLGADAYAGGGVTGYGVTAIRTLTQAEYDALDPPDSGTLYIING